MMANMGQIVADAWEQAILETPSPLHTHVFNEYFSLPMTYRAILDEQPRNYRGDVIPRITIVRRNIRRLGRSRPRLPA